MKVFSSQIQFINHGTGDTSSYGDAPTQPIKIMKTQGNVTSPKAQNKTPLTDPRKWRTMNCLTKNSKLSFSESHSPMQERRQTTKVEEESVIKTRSSTKRSHEKEPKQNSGAKAYKA